MNSKKIPTKLVAAKLVAIAISQSACGVAHHSGDGISITASEKGMQAFSDLLAGTATNAKASPDAPDTPYYQMRRQQGLKVVMPARKEDK